MGRLSQAQIIPEDWIPLEGWVNSAQEYITDRFDGFFDVLQEILDAFVEALMFVLVAPPALLLILLLTAVAFFVAGWRVGLFTVLGLLTIVGLGLWEESMETLALTLAATVVSLAIGIPIGIIAAKNRGFETFIRPVLDVMQTLPAFVYLVPVVVLLSTGNPPALIATVIFATPPAVRLTMLGIQQVPKETVEAAHAFGSTPWQTLSKVELPLSLRSIMAGVNQVIMLSLSMAVIAGLVGFGGLGEIVVAGLGQLNVGQAMVGGVGIVILAIILDRVTRGLERTKDKGGGISKVFSGKRSNPGSVSGAPVGAGSSSDGGSGN